MLNNQLSKNALAIYTRLYFQNNEKTTQQTHKRVSKFISNNNNELKKIFFNLLDLNIFRPNTPCLINAGIRNKSNQDVHSSNLCACFVIKLEDNMNSISKLIRTCMLIYASGAGAGFCIGHLREKNAKLSDGGVASGPISFMSIIQEISDVVKSGGRRRRAANMITMQYNHPDILEFIKCKNNNNFSAMNISIGVDNIFFEKVKNDEDIDLISPTSKKVIKQVKASKIWNLIIDNAYNTGDPGLLFLDTINKFNPLPSYGYIDATNPCGEVPLIENESCNIGSINLNKCLEYDQSANSYYFNETKFINYTHQSIDFLDNIITLTGYPNIDIYNNMNEHRPLGLGIMGLADILYKMKIAYNSNKGYTLFKKICYLMTKTAFEHSIDKCCSKGRFAPYICAPINLSEKDKNAMALLLSKYGVDEIHIKRFKKTGIHNSNVTCIAPTGCLKYDSLLLTSDGIIEIENLNPNPKLKIDNSWLNQNLQIIQEKEISNSNKFYYNGIRDTIKITTEDGYFIEGTPNHKLRIINEKMFYVWKELKDINKEDHICIKLGGHEKLLINKPYIKLKQLTKFHGNTNIKFKQPLELNEELALLIGYYMGDGNLNNQGIKFTISIDHLENAKLIEDFMINIFGINISNIEHRDGCNIYSFNCKSINRFLKLNHLIKIKDNARIGKGSYIPHIPLLIRQSKTSVLCSFLKGLFEADGTIYISRFNKSPIISFTTVHISLANQVQTCLTSLGIMCHFYEDKSIIGKYAKKPRSNFNIRIKSSDYNLIYKEKIGFISDSKKLLLEDIDNIKSTALLIENKLLWEDLFNNFKYGDLKKYSTHKYNILKKNKRGSLSTAKRIIEDYPYLSTTLLGQLIKFNIFINKVKFIEYKQAETMDISVPYRNTYIANSFITHNSISISADCSYAFEPCMGLTWSKKLTDTDKTLYFINKIFEKEALPSIIKQSKKSKTKIIQDIENNHGSIQDLPYISEDIKKIFVTAHDISPLEKIEMQAAGQQYISLAISSTCNLLNSATKEDIMNIYTYAYKMGLKGITIYRDGCKQNQPINFTKDKPTKKFNIAKLKRPIIRYGKTIETKTPVGKLYITINYHNNKPLEVFLTLGKGGQLNNILLDTLARSISLGLQHNVPLVNYIRSFKNTTGDSFWSKIDNKHTQMHKSIIDLTATVFEKNILFKMIDTINNNSINEKYEICPECYEQTLNLNYGGCKGGICINCGFTNCSG